VRAIVLSIVIDVLCRLGMGRAHVTVGEGSGGKRAGTTSLEEAHGRVRTHRRRGRIASVVQAEGPLAGMVIPTLGGDT